MLVEMPHWNCYASVDAEDHFLFEVMGSSKEEKMPLADYEEVRALGTDCGRKTSYELKSSLIHPRACFWIHSTNSDPKSVHYNSERFCEFGEHIPLNNVGLDTGTDCSQAQSGSALCFLLNNMLTSLPVSAAQLGTHLQDGSWRL